MKRTGFLKEGRACCEKTNRVPLFLCAHRPDGGGLLEKMPDGGLLAGWGRALLGQILRDKSRLFRSAKLSRRRCNVTPNLPEEVAWHQTFPKELASRNCRVYRGVFVALGVGQK
jgi:hypothetical protein